MPETTRHALDAAIDARRRELGMRWRDIYDRSGLSQETVRQIRLGNRTDPTRVTDSESRLEDVLQWERGSLQAIRDARPPAPKAGSPGYTGPAEPPSHYPDWVGPDRFERYIYDYPGDEVGDPERLAAIRAVRFTREDRQASEQRGA